MPTTTLLEKYAKLAVYVGANVQKDQPVVIRSTTQSAELARLIAKHAYEAGAKRVSVQWSDDYVNRYGLENMSVETLEDVPEWIVSRAKHEIEENTCLISITSPIPGLNQGVDPLKMQKAGQAMGKKLAFFQSYVMGNNTQWTIVAASNLVWAEKVFPDKKGEEAVEALWEAILKACRVREDNDPVAEWAKHNQVLAAHNAILNQHQFKHLHFTNSLGTDLVIELVKDHVWAGGDETTTKGVKCNPNIPTEETFTMPYKWGTRGKVYATKPLNYQGNLIEDFWLEFKDGKVVDFDAKEAKDSLASLLDYDEGARYLGEIALISHDSPISNANILFYNTLFDENASCHMALGRAYPMNVKDGTSLSQEALNELGSNHSMTHVDFMFGSADLKVVGTTHEGKEVTLIEHGDFVI